MSLRCPPTRMPLTPWQAEKKARLCCEIVYLLQHRVVLADHCRTRSTRAWLRELHTRSRPARVPPAPLAPTSKPRGVPPVGEVSKEV